MTSKSIFIIRWWALATLLICFMSYSQAQENKLRGGWILDIALLNDGDLLPVDHPLFSTQIVYRIDSDKIKINDIEMPAEYTDSTIVLGNRTLNYSFQHDYLCITEEGVSITLCFLRKQNFIERYPAFQAKVAEINGRDVWVANALTAVEFNHEMNIHDFVLSNTPILKRKTSENLFLELDFIVDSASHIKDIVFLTAVPDKIQQQCIEAIKKAEKHYVNNAGREIAVNLCFNFFKMSDSMDNKDARRAFELFQKGESYYSRGNFQNAIAEFEKAKSYDINLKRYRGLFYKDLITHLGIAYLLTDQKEKARDTFLILGDESNFDVRNFLRFYL